MGLRFNWLAERRQGVERERAAGVGSERKSAVRGRESARWGRGGRGLAMAEGDTEGNGGEGSRGRREGADCVRRGTMAMTIVGMVVCGRALMEEVCMGP